MSTATVPAKISRFTNGVPWLDAVLKNTNTNMSYA